MDALLIEMPPPSFPPKTSNAETFTTVYYWRDGGMTTFQSGLSVETMAIE
jgi:hypothetical protein